jgi:(2Fe-2S) ferredoxin
VNADDVPTVAQQIAHSREKLHLGSAGRHIFFCVGGKCAPREEALELWAYLKDRLYALGLADRDGGVLRTKADCLRICAGGPIALVYPEGAWYRAASREAIDRIIEEHLLNGRPVEALMLARNPLPP